MPIPDILQRSHEYQIVYRRENLTIERGKYWLPIRLLQQTVLLPMVNVADKEHPVGIAWLDTNPVVNPELAKDAADAMALQLRSLYAEFVVMPASSKSEPFITDAAGVAGASLIRLPGGKDRDEVISQSAPQSVYEYIPVTGVKKYIGLPTGKDGATLAMALTHGKRVVLVDDVCTTYATIQAMKNILHTLSSNELKLPVAVLAREAPFNEQYPPVLDEMRAVIALPEIAGLDTQYLVPIAQKETIGIPKAVVIGSRLSSS